MTSSFLWWLRVAVIVAMAVHSSPVSTAAERAPLRSKVFHSPPFTLSPGSVEGKYYGDIGFPRGHIALKDFRAELVDEAGNPVPSTMPTSTTGCGAAGPPREPPESLITGNASPSKGPPEYILAGNAGTCEKILRQNFGLGSETRRTVTWVPDPYGIEVGNPAEVPAGYEEKWMMNVHAIDTRGVVDRLGCIECRCEFYNVTVDESGRPLGKDYPGGVLCCHDKARCRTGEGSGGAPRKLFMRYEVKWLDWAADIVPTKLYVLDVTDDGKRGPVASTDEFNDCQVEYHVAPCGREASGACIDSKRAFLVLPSGGNIVYAVAHQHRGGVGAALYGQKAGDEAGYVVGMTTCYPSPGSVKVTSGERVTLISNYNATEPHSGSWVSWFFFYSLLADQSTVQLTLYVTPAIVVYPNPSAWFISAGPFAAFQLFWVLLGGITVASAVVVLYRRRREIGQRYQSLAL
ncbi:unnamed protein product [Spirodela intermedia]|uniref:Uncharacterized protein n=1 Tax=Spirodela intermedia TaxID=51605 RepID=A0A7I8IP31_SPIIN|nr:unnamed protein product [Spirodela intermedia]CAA6659656.1 unnamed protein product [Spirodela intermedia]